MRDLNEGGIKIATSRTLLPSDRLRVRLPGMMTWLLARVVWCSKGVAGLAFARAIQVPGVAGTCTAPAARRPSAQDTHKRIA